jgi:hypothetical protein
MCTLSGTVFDPTVLSETTVFVLHGRGVTPHRVSRKQAWTLTLHEW